ncbi:MAG TPA: hypothetical protein VGX28_17035 [Frankiaceae bacterium]|jgi:hypothetical protein|nr:hypothetical protein [Frankiaceae bacterium]
MKKRLVRLGLVGSLAVAVSAPTTAHAWACLDDVTRTLCFVVGTSCRVVDLATGRGEICQLG